jgi:tRNA U34 5-methylaminomethyl-2-thiouridine-forming methyltransferase MnmC
MEKVKTRDDSETFVNPHFNESYHSFTGAVEEALRKYVEPTKIRELARSGSFKLLDMFFGLGYNSAMAISIALEENPNCVIEVIGVEKDPLIISKISEVNPKISFYSNYKKFGEGAKEIEVGNVRVKLLVMDAYDAVKLLESDYFDAIFYDPFSPKTQEAMWSVELFENMKRVLKKGGTLATYSCARMVRDNMREAGFNYDDGPKVGRRGPGTIAFR